MKVWIIENTKAAYTDNNQTYFYDPQRTRLLSNEWHHLHQTSWPQRISNWLIVAGILSAGIFALLIVLLGFITALYLLPIWGSILFVYWLIQNKK